MPGLRVLLFISQELFSINFKCVYSATPTSICALFHQKLFFLCFMINKKNVEQTEIDGMEIKGGSESGWWSCVWTEGRPSRTVTWISFFIFLFFFNYGRDPEGFCLEFDLWHVDIDHGIHFSTTSCYWWWPESIIACGGELGLHYAMYMWLWRRISVASCLRGRGRRLVVSSRNGTAEVSSLAFPYIS